MTDLCAEPGSSATDSSAVSGYSIGESFDK
jgi:hypothetical protein